MPINNKNNTGKINICRLNKSNEKEYFSICNLIKQLYPENEIFSFNEFKQIIDNKNIYTYVAVLNEKIIGCSQMVFYKKISGTVYIIEDVVVDIAVRRMGIGSKLIMYMLEDAKANGADFVDLATRSKEALNFYTKIGFEDKAKERPFWGLRYNLKV